MTVLGQRIRELRGQRSAADVARRAGIKPAYLHAIENATPGRSGKPARPSVPVLRSLADALGASRAELLELAGHEDDAAYDQVREMKAARAATPQEPTTPELMQELRRITEALAERLRGEEDGEDGPGAQRLRSGPPGTHNTGTHGRKRRA